MRSRLSAIDRDCSIGLLSSSKEDSDDSSTSTMSRKSSSRTNANTTTTTTTMTKTTSTGRRYLDENDVDTVDDDTFTINYVSKMSIDECIGQMSQIEINMLLNDDKMTLNIDVANKYIGEYGIGSVLNVPTSQSPWTARQFREIAIQLNQIATKYNHPPVLWGIDSVHGANYIANAIVSPQPINIAATFNRTTSYWAGQIASRDTRSAGIQWLFSPLVGIGIHSKWSRIYETFGEDPYVVGTMASAMITGIQQPMGDTIYPYRAAACAKHFIGYSNPHNGHDRSPSWIPRRHLYQYFVPPWKYVVGSIKNEKRQSYSKAMTVMESYTEIDGVPLIANKELLNYLLRYRLQFDGVLVTDYSEIYNLLDWHHTVGTKLDSVITSIVEGSVDISMIPWDAELFINSIKEGLSYNAIHEDRIRQSTQRIIKLKYDLGMFNNTLTIVDSDLNNVGSQTDRDDALAVAQDSIVLVKNNDDVLPIKDKAVKIHVTGPTSDSITSQSGGWTSQWQGISDETIWSSYGTTVLDAIKKSYTSVTYTCGVDIIGNDCTNDKETKFKNWDDTAHVIDNVKHWVGLTPSTSIARTIEMSKNSDYVIICIGEEAYAEKPGDIRSLYLPKGQYDLVNAISQNINTDTTKIILLYFGGRPRLLNTIVSKVDAIVIGFLPGPDGGQAVSNIVDGTINPSGRLPITYPSNDDIGGVPYFHSVSDQCTTDGSASDEVSKLPHYQYVQCPVQWNFGYGLSYTTFTYTKFTASGGINEDLHVSVVVTNTGTIPGKETVLFFTFDTYRIGVTPEYKRLRAYDKVLLQPNESIVIRKIISEEELQYIGPHDDTHAIYDPTMKSIVGVGATTDCRIDSATSDPLCIMLSAKSTKRSVKSAQEYSSACDVACTLWMDSGCNVFYNGMNTMKSCQDLCVGIGSLSSSTSSILNDGWGWNYVNCLESVVWGMQQRQTTFTTTGSSNNDNNNDEQTTSTTNDCWMMTSLCRDVFTSGIRNEYGQSIYDTSSSQQQQQQQQDLSSIISKTVVDGGCKNPYSVQQILSSSESTSGSAVVLMLIPMLVGCIITILCQYVWYHWKKSPQYTSQNIHRKIPDDDERFSSIQFTEVRMVN